MDPTRIDLSAKSSRFIAENSEIPPDITFKFTDADSDEETVAAHKIILAMVSQIFRNMFFVHNTLDRSANEMLLVDTTKKPFQIMIDAIYEVRPMKENLQGKSLHEVFAVMYLVTKYQIRELELAVKEFISSFPITDVTVLQIASDAETYYHYSSSFEEAVQSILLRCAQFLKPKLADAKSVLRFVAENGDRNATVYKLIVLINDMDDVPPSDAYSNCGKSPCQHGDGVEGDQFREGLKVAHNHAVQRRTYGFWDERIKKYTGEVVKNVSRNALGELKIKYCMIYEGGQSSAQGYYEKYYDGKCKFLFHCK